MSAIDMKEKTQAAEMDIQGLTEGCNRAIVVYSLEEDYFASKGFRTRKMVILYDNDGFCRETVNKGISNIMIMHGQSLMKSHMYITNESGKWKKSLFQFAAFLLRPILGVLAGNDIIDITNESKKYNKGRGLSW